VTIFDKADGRVEYREDSGERQRMVFGIKMLEKRALVGGDDGIVRILERDSESQWRLAHSLTGRRGITHIDGDENWACTGTRDLVQVWDLTSLHLLQTKHQMPVKVWMLAFSFPFVMVVGGEDWAGLKVFHVTTGELVRDIKSKKYHNVQCSAQIVTLCQMNVQINKDVEVLMYDIRQLTNKNIIEKNLWFKRMEFQVGRSIFSQVEAVSNTTKLFVCAKNRLSVFDFWKDGAIPICTEVDEEETDDEDEDGHSNFDSDSEDNQ